MPRLRRRRRWASRAARARREGLDRPLELLHLLARCVHEVDVLGQRLAQRARHRLDAPVGHQPTTDLGLDQLPELLQAGLELLALEPVGQRVVGRLVARLALAALGAAFHHPLGQAVVVELPQRAVQVVGAADRTPRLHPREARHRHRRQLAELLAVHVHQGGEEHLGELLVAHALAGTAAPLLTGYATRLVARLAVGTLAVAAVLVADASRVQREVDVEDGVERAPVAEVLHQRGREHLAERLALLQRDVLDRAHGVEVLGHRHRQPRRPQLVHEPLEHVEHHARPDARRHLQLVARHGVRQLRGIERHGMPYERPVGDVVSTSSLRAFAMSVWYFSNTCRVSPITCGSIVPCPR